MSPLQSISPLQESSSAHEPASESSPVHEPALAPKLNLESALDQSPVQAPAPDQSTVQAPAPDQSPVKALPPDQCPVHALILELSPVPALIPEIIPCFQSFHVKAMETNLILCYPVRAMKVDVIPCSLNSQDNTKETVLPQSSLNVTIEVVSDFPVCSCLLETPCWTCYVHGVHLQVSSLCGHGPWIQC